MRWIALLGLVSCACVSPATATRSAPIRPATGSSLPPPPEPALRGRAPDPGEATPEAADVFRWWDRDRDGVLTADELTEIWIAHLDRDRDGAITPSEWPG
jgi:hypothetical protein